MVEQIRNQELVELLRPDFFARYEPNAAMVHSSLHSQLPMLRAYWPFSSVDENGDVYDISGQGRVLNNNNTTPFAWHNLLPYADLTPGATNYFNRVDEAGLDITGDLSLGGWFWLDTLAPGNDMGLIAKWTVAGNQRAYYLKFVDATNQFQFSVSTDGAAVVTVTSTAVPVINTWYHICGVFRANSVLNIFVDGVKTELAVGVPASIFNSSADLQVGASDVGTNRLDGRVCQCFLCAENLDDVMIWNLYQQTRANFGK